MMRGEQYVCDCHVCLEPVTSPTRDFSHCGVTWRVEWPSQEQGEK